MSVISIKNFSKKYGDFLAVDNISLTVNKGEIIGFVGKNGAGKSTTIRSMVNMIFPTKGEILINDLDSVKDSKKIKKQLSYVPSESSFYDNMKVEELLDFCLKFCHADKERISALANYFELDLKKKISELSLGNAKKVSIVQAFLKESDVIVLDEPTSGLDPLMQNKFFDLLLKEKEKGVTIFLSSHNLSEIEKYCDKVIIIKDGKIVDMLEMKNVKLKHKQTVSYVLKNNEQKSFDFDGDINELLKELSKLDLISLEVKNKTVEDEFIDYYKEDDHHDKRFE
ncbi:Vitamin B12 import ATP-binding protein BtuD [bioreactor metagenome]|uniref:Vitamin B12 import ATP-binding protein BtuD n=1 Tax=bioreactor metagenome TaxID=1076179 RepID=A0A645CAB8_9ZZZZ